jgi:hypothetical protein
MTTITSLSRDQKGKIINAYDKAQGSFDHAHSALLTACRTGARGPILNELLVELDRAADFIQEHRRNVGRLLDDLGED